MARTRGASAFHQDDGELLDKDGKPIPTNREAFIQAVAAPVVAVDPTPPPAPTTFRYLSDAIAWQRDMEAFEAMHLLNLMLGGISVEMSAEEWSAQKADVKRHFRRVAVVVE